MHVGIQTWGSTGDIRPLLALAAGLRTAGHEVTAVVSSVDDVDFGPQCRQAGGRYVRVPERMGIDWLAVDRRLRNIGEGSTGIRGALADLGLDAPAIERCLQAGMYFQLRLTFELGLFPFLPEIYAAAQALCASCDVVVGHAIMWPLRAAAELAARPHVAVVIDRQFVPTAYAPPSASLPELGRLANRILWAFAKSYANRKFGREPLVLWRSVGLPDFRDVLTGACLSRHLNLIAASRLLSPQYPDYGTRTRVCGHFRVPEEADPWRMPDELRAFLDAGSPPVYMTMGSSGKSQPELLAELFGAVARRVGCRAIVQTFSERYNALRQDGEVYYVPWASYPDLFPHCAAVLHHCGGGTSHAVALAGKPTIAVPEKGDQLDWAKSLCRLGIAAEPCLLRDAAPERLAALVARVLDSPVMAERARQVGAEIAREDGIATAVGAIEELASRA